VVRRLRGYQLRRLRPFSNGASRGEAVVRKYWDRFLAEHRSDIRGLCLEVGSTATLRRYGGSALSRADGLDLTKHSQDITVVADLSRADQIPGSTYDCLVIPFTMHLIYDIEAALYHSVRLLKTGGVLLANFPCVDYYFARGLDMRTGTTLHVFWWFTPILVENLMRRTGLRAEDYTMKVDGNLFARIAYQLNMPMISVRVVKPAGWNIPCPEYRQPWTPATEPDRWNPVTGHYPPA
jgi:hypothetical protein